MKVCLAAFFAVASTAPAHAAPKVHVLIISVDGMRPDYITNADRHGLKKTVCTEHLCRRRGWSDSNNNLSKSHDHDDWVWPIEHGIFGNQKFTPLKEGKEQITEFSDIKVRTLWEAAHEAGYTIASIGWPVTTGSKFIDWLLPVNARIARTNWRLICLLVKNLLWMPPGTLGS